MLKLIFLFEKLSANLPIMDIRSPNFISHTLKCATSLQKLPLHIIIHIQFDSVLKLQWRQSDIMWEYITLFDILKVDSREQLPDNC